MVSILFRTTEMIVWHSEWAMDLKTLISSYSAVLYWSNNAFAKRDAELGNLLADFVNYGGGVIIMCFGTFHPYRFLISRMLRMSSTWPMAIRRL